LKLGRVELQTWAGLLDLLDKEQLQLVESSEARLRGWLDRHSAQGGSKVAFRS